MTRAKKISSKSNSERILEKGSIELLPFSSNVSQRSDMEFIDLTHSIVETMPVYPGTEPPDIVEANSIDQHGFREKKISFYSHTGTHVDAPAHVFKGGRTLDDFPIDSFQGKAAVYTHKSDAKTIEVNHLRTIDTELKAADFLLIATGWDRYWGEDKYFRNFPVLSLEAVHWLEQFKLKGVGLDVISADPVDAAELVVHFALLQQNILIFENLKNLIRIPATLCNFTGLPLSIAAGDGSPIRAFAAVEQVDPC